MQPGSFIGRSSVPIAGSLCIAGSSFAYAVLLGTASTTVIPRLSTTSSALWKPRSRQSTIIAAGKLTKVAKARAVSTITPRRCAGDAGRVGGATLVTVTVCLRTGPPAVRSLLSLGKIRQIAIVRRFSPRAPLRFVKNPATRFDYLRCRVPAAAFDSREIRPVTHHVRLVMRQFLPQ